jgi:hypothetical protein
VCEKGQVGSLRVVKSWPEARLNKALYQVPLIRTHGATFEGRRRTRPTGAATSHRFRSAGLGISGLAPTHFRPAGLSIPTFRAPLITDVSDHYYCVKFGVKIQAAHSGGASKNALSLKQDTVLRFNRFEIGLFAEHDPHLDFNTSCNKRDRNIVSAPFEWI